EVGSGGARWCRCSVAGVARRLQPSVPPAPSSSTRPQRRIIPPMSVSRRDFLKSAGVTSLATAVTSVAVPDAAAQTGPAVVGPGEVPVALTVNGARLDLNIEPRVTLLDALRTRADLTGNQPVCRPRRLRA